MSQSLKKKFFKNTAIVSIFTMISRIFGYIRDAAIFIFISNTNGALDAFFVAFDKSSVDFFTFFLFNNN